MKKEGGKKILLLGSLDVSFLFQKVFSYVATNNTECSLTPLKITLKKPGLFGLTRKMSKRDYSLIRRPNRSQEDKWLGHQQTNIHLLAVTTPHRLACLLQPAVWLALQK